MAASGARSEPPLVVIVGPTASGKTALAIELAEMYGGEIICADSRTVYQGMDIGTAKPTSEEQARVPHWGLDLVQPDEHFTVADFQAYAYAKIAEIRERGHIPLLVGGTGLYVDSVLFNFSFGKQGIWRQAPIPNVIMAGIATGKQLLRARIAARAEQLFSNGVVEEAIILGKKYGWDTPALTGNIYPLAHRYVEGELTESKIIEKFTTLDWRLAKRQMTWLRPNPHIEWCVREEVATYVARRLASE